MLKLLYVQYETSEHPFAKGIVNNEGRISSRQEKQIDIITQGKIDVQGTEVKVMTIHTIDGDKLFLISEIENSTISLAQIQQELSY